MVTLKTIDEADLIDYLNTQSDFAFELHVLNTLIAKGFTCEHGGSYDDPVTRKPREFDIRATKTVRPFRVRLAVECKNLHTTFPLLISCRPRRPEEAFHEVIAPIGAPSTRGFTVPALQPRARAVHLMGADRIYKPNDPVGKSCTQVKRQDNALYASDSELYDKWAQALSSAQDLIDIACDDAGEHRLFTAAFPILVVPDGRLWMVVFDANGARVGDPRQTERCSYFIGRSYVGDDKLRSVRYLISHLEFVTLTGLVTLADDLFVNATFGGEFGLSFEART
jgi:hypothetical protein